MASNIVHVCRFCSNGIPPKNSAHLFSSEALRNDLPGRLSTLLHIPVCPDDGHPCHYFRPCMRKFLAAESFVLASKSSYESRSREGVESSPVRSTLQSVRKRGKNSSGPDVSLFTTSRQPLSKRSTGGAPGRRLAFEPCEYSPVFVIYLY